MADGILEPLVGFFCPTSESASACNEFISNPNHQVLSPVGPLFYFLLFPLVFTILFIYILSTTILHGPGNTTKGMKLMIGVSVFIFIIISGWYPIMLLLSEFWFIMIILLFGVYYFLSRHWKGGGGGAPGTGGKMPGGTMGGLSGELLRRGTNRWSGKEKRLEKEVDLKLKDLRDIKEKSPKTQEAWRAYSDVKNSAWAIINEFKDLTSVYGIPIGGGYERKIAEMEDIMKEVDKKRPKNYN